MKECFAKNICKNNKNNPGVPLSKRLGETSGPTGREGRLAEKYVAACHELCSAVSPLSHVNNNSCNCTCLYLMLFLVSLHSPVVFPAFWVVIVYYDCVVCAKMLWAERETAAVLQIDQSHHNQLKPFDQLQY